jgi:hypothetical protein
MDNPMNTTMRLALLVTVLLAGPVFAGDRVGHGQSFGGVGSHARCIAAGHDSERSKHLAQSGGFERGRLAASGGFERGKARRGFEKG